MFEQIQTPYYLIHKSLLDDNVNCFRDALKSQWSNSILSYSIKTNSLPWLLKYLHGKGLMLEAVSDEEYQLAKKCGAKDSDIIFNGPIKSDEQLLSALNNGAIVNIDSIHELDCIKKSRPDISQIGIRININTDVFDSSDISCKEEGFRFGFCVENGDFDNVVSELQKLYGRKLQIGIHAHCNSATRSVSVYEDIARYIGKMILDRKSTNFSPAYIDIGGGFFGGVEGKPKADDYIKAVRAQLDGIVDFSDTKLIVEPGSAIIGSVADLCTTVLDVKDTTKSRIVTTDGSRIFVDALWKKTGYQFSVEKDKESVDRSQNSRGLQVICGYTCMDYDRIMRLENHEEFLVGDRIIYHKVGAYSITFGGPFIRYFPDVYIEDMGRYIKIRQRMTVDDYYSLMYKEKAD